jgi:hypothetical protein
MPDFIIHATWVCESNVHWETTVPGSKPGTSYRVAYEFRPYPSMVQYDWTCECHAFKFGKGKYCKHIEAVKASHARCGWNWELEPGMEAAKDANGEPCCPVCGRAVTAMKVAV